MSSRDWNTSRSGKKMPPLYGGVRSLSNVRLHVREPYIEPEDLYNKKYSFRTEDEFKYLIAYYLDAMRKKKGLTAKQLSKNINKAPSSFAVMKYSGVSTFELFLSYCNGLSIDPVKTFDRCLELFSHFQSR